jgi:plastocyanin
MNFFFAVLAFLSAHRGSLAVPGQIIDITEDNYFIRAPATARPGLTTVRLHSPHGGHQFELFRLEGGHSVSDLVAAMGAKPRVPTPWATEMGGAGYPPPKGTVNASYILEPGRYAIICAVHDRKTGMQHFQMGMYTEFTVAGRRVSGDLPAPDITVNEVEYKWEISQPITAGKHILRVTNSGSHYHETKILRVFPGHTLDEIVAWKPGQPRIDETFATVTTMAPGVSVTTSIDFPAGDYVLWCVPQTDHGMHQALTVSKRTK